MYLLPSQVEAVAVVGLEVEEQEINLIALQNGHREQNREPLVSTWECPLRASKAAVCWRRHQVCLFSVDSTELSTKEIFRVLGEHGAKHKGNFQCVSVTAWMGNYSGTHEPRNTTGQSKHSGLQPCSRERLPQCNSFPMKLLHPGPSPWECNNPSLLDQGIPGKCYSPVLLCSAQALSLLWQKKVFTQTPLKRYIGGKNPGEWLPLPGWKEALAN